MQKTYEIVEPSAPAMRTQEYIRYVMSELRTLLDADEGNERRYQELLEEHPCLVPGANLATDVGGNGLYPPGVITQPRLSGLKSRIPDFCIISHDSGSVYATLVEIESPSKHWANKNGSQSAKFTEAFNQIKDWKVWFSEQLNKERFLKDFQIPDSLYKDKTFEQRYILIYGRRKEMQKAGFQRLRAQKQAPDELLMTWDRITPNPYLYSAFTVRLTATGYRAHRVPPTVELGPAFAENHSIISGKEEAVDNSPLIPAARAEFLKNRWQYWDTWAQQNKLGLDLQSYLDRE